MIKWFESFTRSMEDPNNPLMGPNIKLLDFAFLLIKQDLKKNAVVAVVQIIATLFMATAITDLFLREQIFSDLLFNTSVAAVIFVSFWKTLLFILFQKQWFLLFENIAEEEKREANKLDKITLKIIKDYTKHSRFVMYLYLGLVFLTCLAMISLPFIKYYTMQEYRSGDKPFPTIVCSWFPFDETKFPGNVVAFIIHTLICLLGVCIISAFDSNAVTIMTFLKGQTLILHEKCRLIFGMDEEISKQEVCKRIKECHRQHEYILQQSRLFDSLLSPIMFVYVLVCSLSICCSVVQLSLDEINTSQKLWVFEYTIALTVQLFIYCWHGNEIIDLSYKTDRAIFESNWWRADKSTLKQLILLDGKLFDPIVLNAGPFYTLSLNSFTALIKGAYSFYTLFSQMQENN